MPITVFTIHAEWDDEAEVWTVTDSDVPGLVAEAATTEDLMAKLRTRVPELVRLNRHLLPETATEGLPIHLMAERVERIRYSA